jgi:hypothetical protein
MRPREKSLFNLKLAVPYQREKREKRGYALILFLVYVERGITQE